MVGHMRFGMRLLVCLLGVGAVLGLTGCPGGCFTEADPVNVSPAINCLSFAADSCNPDSLDGTNTCAEALTLPPTEEGGSELSFAPGAQVSYPLSRSSPGIRIIQGKHNTNWVISARVGEQNIAITVTIHEKD